jgi:hypothetical protein
MHPLPQILSWLPLEVTNCSDQTVSSSTYGETKCITFQEKALIQGLTLIEPTVVNIWDIKEVSPNICEVTFSLRFEYESANLLQGLVELNSRLELEKFYSLLEEAVIESISSYHIRMTADKPKSLTEQAEVDSPDSPLRFFQLNELLKKSEKIATCSL